MDGKRKAGAWRTGAVLRRTVPAAVLLTFLLQAAPLAADSEYRLGPEDRIRLKVFEWRASRDEIFGWEALNDEYALGSAGELSLPLVGEVQAGGITRGELAGRISEQLAGRMGLGRRPTVAVEIVQYRPFYIVGPVSQPGAYPFRPGMTVLKAVSLAGGLPTRPENGRAALITGVGELEVLLLQRDQAMARIARVKAELAGSDVIEVPEELSRRKTDPPIARLLAEEQAIFEARRDAFKTQMAALEQLQAHLLTEIPKQEALLDTVAVQNATLQEEMETIGGVLASESTRVRRLAIERAMAQTDGDRLRGETSLLRARQEVSKAEISIIELRTQHTQNLTTELRDSQAQLDQLEHRVATTGDLIEEAELMDPSSAPPGRKPLKTAYSILREENGAPVELAADETTAVQPGDAIRVELRRDRTRGLDSEM